MELWKLIANVHWLGCKGFEGEETIGKLQWNLNKIAMVKIKYKAFTSRYKVWGIIQWIVQDGLEWFCIHGNCEFLFMQIKFYMVV
jgi:hypothetical protein